MNTVLKHFLSDLK